MPRCQRGGLSHARPKAMGVSRWGGRPAAGRQAAERGLAHMCHNVSSRRGPPSIRGESRADSMVGLSSRANRKSSRVPHDLCLTRNLNTYGMCATCNTSRRSLVTISRRGSQEGSSCTQVLDFDCQTRHAVILRQHGAAGAERGPGRSRPAQWSRIASGEEQWNELLHENAAARTLTRLLPRRRRRRLVRVEALAIGKRLARFDKRCIRRGIDIAPCKSTKHLIVLRQALLKSLIVRAALSGVPVHPLTLDDRGERRDGHAGGDAYGTHARPACCTQGCRFEVLEHEQRH